MPCSHCNGYCVTLGNVSTVTPFAKAENHALSRTPGKLLGRRGRGRDRPLDQRSTHGQLPALCGRVEPHPGGDDGDLRGLPAGARHRARTVRKPLRLHRPPEDDPLRPLRVARRRAAVRPGAERRLDLRRSRFDGDRGRPVAEPRDGRDGGVQRARPGEAGELDHDRVDRGRSCACHPRRRCAHRVRAHPDASQFLGAVCCRCRSRCRRVVPSAPHGGRGNGAVAPATARRAAWSTRQLRHLGGGRVRRLRTRSPHPVARRRDRPGTHPIRQRARERRSPLTQCRRHRSQCTPRATVAL